MPDTQKKSNQNQINRINKIWYQNVRRFWALQNKILKEKEKKDKREIINSVVATILMLQ